MQNNDTAEARERLRVYLENIGRLDLMPAPRKAGETVTWTRPTREPAAAAANVSRLPKRPRGATARETPAETVWITISNADYFNPW